MYESGVQLSAMSYAERIIDEKFGGVRPMAKKLGIAPTTVQGWKSSGMIPAKRQQRVLEVALEHGINLTPADFFREPPSASATPDDDAGSPATADQPREGDTSQGQAA